MVGARSIEVRNLSVRYAESEPFVLKMWFSLSKKARWSRSLAPRAAGRPLCLLKVILGLLPPTEGEVLIGGANVAHLGMKAYRDMIGTVMQEDQLFGASIAANIWFFDPEPDPAWMVSCAQLAAIHEDIVAL